MNTKVLALYGSPRRDGNTDFLMDELLSGISRDGGVKVEKLYVSQMDVKPCSGCGYCEKTGKCCIKDEMQDIYPLLENAHLILISSPVYYFGITAQCKALIDRTHLFWARKHKLKRQWSSDDDIIRQGYFISVAGTDVPNLFVGGEMTVKAFFECMDIMYRGSYTVSGIQEFESIKNKSLILKEAYNKGVELMNPH